MRFVSTWIHQDEVSFGSKRNRVRSRFGILFVLCISFRSGTSSVYARPRMAVVRWGRISGSESNSTQDIGPSRWYRSRKASMARLLRPPFVAVSIWNTVSGHKIPWARLWQHASCMTLESAHSSSSKTGPIMYILVVMDPNELVTLAGWSIVDRLSSLFSHCCIWSMAITRRKVSPPQTFLVQKLLVLDSCRKADEMERKHAVTIQRTTHVITLREPWNCFILDFYQPIQASKDVDVDLTVDCVKYLW